MIFEIEWDAVLDPMLSLLWIQYLQGQCCARSVTRDSQTFAKHITQQWNPSSQPHYVHLDSELCQHISCAAAPVLNRKGWVSTVPAGGPPLQLPDMLGHLTPSAASFLTHDDVCSQG